MDKNRLHGSAGEGGGGGGSSESVFLGNTQPSVGLYIYLMGQLPKHTPHRR